MVIKRNSNKIAYGIKHYTFDTEADLLSSRFITIQPGSTAFIVDTSTTFMLNEAYQWIKIKSSNNNSEGGNTPPDSGGNDNEGENDDVIWDGGDVV